MTIFIGWNMVKLLFNLFMATIMAVIFHIAFGFNDFETITALLLYAILFEVQDVPKEKA